MKAPALAPVFVLLLGGFVSPVGAGGLHAQGPIPNGMGVKAGQDWSPMINIAPPPERADRPAPAGPALWTGRPVRGTAPGAGGTVGRAAAPSPPTSSMMLPTSPITNYDARVPGNVACTFAAPSPPPGWDARWARD